MGEYPAARYIELFDAFGAGVYFLFACIHLDLWLRRRARTGHLWLACASLSALVVNITGVLIRWQEPEPSKWLGSLNALGVAAATVALLELVSSLERAPLGRLARGFQILLLVMAPVSGMLIPVLSGFTLAGCFLMLLWAMARAFRAAGGGDRDSVIVARGFMVLNLCLLGDLLGEMNVLPLPHGLPILGFIVLFLASARSLNDRFDREEAASRTDALTGLPNRRGFLETCESVLAICSRSGRPVSVVMADLDRFKDVNDTSGHAAGDHLLKTVANTIRASLRAQDVVARWGRDEMVILLPDTGREEALHVAEKLRAAVAGLAVSHNGIQIRSTLSLGVAENAEGMNLGEAISLADAALYRAKEDGRNRVASDD